MGLPRAASRARTNVRPTPCRHANQDRGACCDCGRVFGEGRPATKIPALSVREQRADDERRHVDDMAEVLAVAHGALYVAGFYMAEADGMRVSARCLDCVVGELVDFDLRCGAGDVAGAVVALRAFLARFSPGA